MKSFDEKIANRMDHITEEMQEEENLLYFSSFHPMNCPLCEFYYDDHPLFLSFEDLIYHLDIRHENEGIEKVVEVQETLLQEFFAYKIAYERKRGRFSN